MIIKNGYLPDDYLKDEVQLIKELHAIRASKKIPESDQGKWSRTFFYYELSREICIHWIGTEPLEIHWIMNLQPELQNSHGGRLLLSTTHYDLSQNDFLPWKQLDHKTKHEYVSKYSDQVEAINSGRTLWLNQDYAPNIAAQFRTKGEVDDILEAVKGDGHQLETIDTLMSKTEGLHEECTATDRFLNRLKKTGPKGWLVAYFNPDEPENWDRQFESWKHQQKIMYKIKFSKKRKRNANEPIDDWLNQLSRLRILRPVNWQTDTANSIQKISYLKPTKKSIWLESVSKIHSHCLRYFGVEMPEDWHTKAKPRKS